jgi:hypothetical protein
LLVVGVAGVEPDELARPGPLGVVLLAAAQQPSDPIQGVFLAVAVPGQFLLDASAHLVDGGEPQPSHVERVEHAGRRGQPGAQRGGVAAVRVGDAATTDARQPGSRGAVQQLSALAERPSTTSSSRATPPRRRVRSTIRVTNSVGVVAVAAVNAVSSTPTARTWSRRGRVVDQRPAVVAHGGHDRAPATPISRATDSPPRPTRSVAAARARWVSDARAAIASDVSDQVETLHCGCRQR